MDPVTGLSRRSLLFLAVAVALGVAASTLAVMIEASAEGACPDQAYGCAAFEAGEAVQLAVLVPEEGGLGPTDLPSHLAGHPVVVHELAVECSVEASVAAAREIATDPPDGPPFLAAVSATCPRATLPVAQILDDSGITLVVTGEPPRPPGPAGFTLLGADPPASLEAVLDAAGALAVLDGGDLLVPRTPLRDDLGEASLDRLDPERPHLG